MAGVLLTLTASADAAPVTGVTGSAYGWFGNVGLIKGAQTPGGTQPSVTLPADGSGSTTAVTATDPPCGPSGSTAACTTGASKEAYTPGPTHIYESGTTSVSTQGHPDSPVSGPAALTSSVDIDGCAGPVVNSCSAGQIYAGPFTVRPTNSTTPAHISSSCTADGNGMRGSTTFSHGSAVVFVHSDANGNGLTNVPIPNSPDPNTIITGTNEQSGINGTFRWIFNEQIINSDGSLTVNAAHEFLGMNQPPPPASESPAKGELIVGHVVCGVTPTIAPPATTDAGAPTCAVLGFRRAPTPPDPSLPATDEMDVIATDPGGGPLGQAGRGLRSLTNVVVSNGTVNTTSRFWGTNRPPVWGTPVPTVSNFPAQGDTTTAVIATKRNQGSPMTFSFDVTAEAGVTTHCSASESNIAGPVVGLVAAAANGSAVVSWSPPAANGGTAVTSYSVSTNAPSGGLAPAAVSVAASSCSPNCTTVVSGLSNSLTLAGRGGYSFGVVASNANGAGVSSTSNTVFPQVVLGSFTAVTPARILDTRTPAQDPTAPIGQCTPPGSPGFKCSQFGTSPVKVQVTGLGGIPAAGVNAAVVNVAVVGPSASSVLKIWPDDASEPNASNLNYTPGRVIPNLVTVKLGADGGVFMRNLYGTTDVVADMAGWFSDRTATPGAPSATAGSRFNPVTPFRVLDTRTPAQDPSAPIGQCTPAGSPSFKCSQFANTAVKVQVAGVGAVPSAAAAVVMNVAVVGPSASSVLKIWPDDAAEPNASNLNYTTGQVIPNLVTVKLGADGGVNMRNLYGTTDVVADAAGWYSQAGSITGDRYTPLTPARVLDTRTQPQDPSAPIGQCTPPGSPSFTCTRFGSSIVKVQISGLAGVPASGASAAAMNVTAISPSASSVLKIWPDDAAEPNASNLNYTPGQVISNLVVVKLGADGGVDMRNLYGAVDVVADAGGWFNDGSS